MPTGVRHESSLGARHAALTSELVKESDPVKRMLNLAARYPRLYHYTHHHSLRPLLTSKGLLARPTWDFADTEEYVYGLRVIRSELRRVRNSEKRRVEIASDFLNSFGDARPPVLRVLSQCIDLISYEISNYNNPAVRVYVACLSSDGQSEKMRSVYGDCVVGFNFELPTIAYHAPLPFTSSMLSRVAYDEEFFRSTVISLALFPSREHADDLDRQKRWLESQDSGVRSDAVAQWSTEKLCLLAPNLKRPEYAFENEWRLKSAASTYSTSDEFHRRTDQSQLPHLPDTAVFVEPEKIRYLHQLLSIDGRKMIVSGLAIHKNAADQDFGSWVDQWLTENRSVANLPLELLLTLHEQRGRG